MLIQSLEIQGFKSFPDRTVLTFDRGITAVVGPNGSGKSNISDAVRWVLGEQSTKSLRGTKMEDVVFNGTASRRPQGYAEVSLSIDNTDRGLAFDQDAVRITRRYYRSGESEYLINGAAVRLKDVNELFMDTGLGRDGYSVIGQGKIADIVSGRSEDRREIFEEAAGISRYRYRKTEAERRLAQAQENLLRLNDILQELADRVGPLGEQAEKAKQFLEFSTEKKGLEIGLWLITIDRLGDQLRSQEEKLAAVQLQYDDMGAELAQLAQEIQQTSDRVNRCAVEIDALRRKMTECERSAAQLDSENAVRRNDIAHYRENIARIDQEMQAAAATEAETAAARQQLEADADAQRSACRTLDDRIGAQTQTQAEMLRRLNDGTEQENRLREELAVIQSALSDARTADATAETTISEINGRMESVRAEYTAAQARRSQLEAQAADSQQRLRDQEARRAALDNTIQGYAMRQAAQQKRMNDRRAAVDQLQLDAESERRRVKLLEDLERSYEGFAHSVKVVMQEHTRGTLPGIHGPVSRILQVPEQYAAAIETALGAAMQNIVCASESDAKRAIALLKQRDSGRATFLPLSTIKGSVLTERGLDDCFGFVGVASELVSCDGQYQEICRSLLGRIAIAEDLDSAVTIARQFHYRFRIVTLDGQVVNAGGSLTGGSLAKNAGLLSRAAQIEKARKKADALARKADVERAQLKQLQEAYSADDAALLAVNAEKTALQEEIIRTQAEQTRLASLMEAAADTVAQRAAEQQKAEARLRELASIRAQARGNLTEAEEKRAGTEQALHAAERQKSEIQQQSAEADRQLAALQLERVTAEKERERFTQQIDELDRRSSDRAAHLQESAAQRAQWDAQIAEAEQQIAARTAQKQELEQQQLDAGAQIAAQSNARMQLEQAQQALRTRERDRAVAQEKCKGELDRLRDQSDGQQKALDEILAKLWEEYELTQREAREQAAPVPNPAQAQRRLTELRGKIRALGSVNVAAIEEYKEVRARYDFLKGQLDDVEKSRSELTALIARLTDEMKKQFTERFQTINRAFGETFRDLFGGGTANLSLTDPSDVLHSDIQIAIEPQGKIITNIDALSGGEKSLAAIALYFAIIKVSPTPFCILDEIEAALDDVNVNRFADYLRRMSDRTQYIAITHRRGTMEEADVLYGVTMQEKGVSKILRLPIGEVEAKLGIH